MVLRNAALSALVGKQTRLHRVILLYGVAHLHVLDPEAKQGALRPVAHLRSTERREDYLHRREILHGERETLLQHEVVGIDVRANQFLRPHGKRQPQTFNCSQSSFGNEPGTLDGVLGYVYRISGSFG